jgi:hypothetical protein
MQEGHSREVIGQSDFQRILRRLCKVHYNVDMSLPMVTISSEIAQVTTLNPSFFKLHYDIIVHSMPESSRLSLSFRFFGQCFECGNLNNRNSTWILQVQHIISHLHYLRKPESYCIDFKLIQTIDLDFRDKSVSWKEFFIVCTRWYLGCTMADYNLNESIKEEPEIYYRLTITFKIMATKCDKNSLNRVSRPLIQLKSEDTRNITHIHWRIVILLVGKFLDFNSWCYKWFFLSVEQQPAIGPRPPYWVSKSI